MSKMELRIRGTNAERRMIYLLMKDDLLPFAIDCEGYTVSLAELGIQYTSMKAGYLAWWDQLSKLFPEVYIQPCIVTGKSYTSVELLRFETYAGGMNIKNISDKDERVHYAIQQCVKRFLSNTSDSSKGTAHKCKITTDRRVVGEGDNTFDQCNTENWMNIVKVSCGNLHTAALDENGNVYTCGANSIGQTSAEGITNAKDIACGRFFTAVLLEEGTVHIFGETSDSVERYDYNSQSELHFPFDLTLNTKDTEGINNIENLNTGEDIYFEYGKEQRSYTSVSLDFFTSSGKFIGESKVFSPLYGLMRDLEKLHILDIKAVDVLPLSKRKKGSKSAKVSLNISNKTAFIHKPVKEWRSIVAVRAVYDAVYGKDEYGNIYYWGDSGNTNDKTIKALFIES